MEPVLLLTLAGLALVDSTSFGTLVIPLWLMTSPTGMRAGRVLAFLAVVGAFYLAVGVALLYGGAALGHALGGAVDDLGSAAPVRWLQLLLGVALLVASFRVGGRSAGESRVVRWRDRAVGGQGSVRAVALLALAAATLEVATMLPYLAALGLLGGSGLAVPAQLALLSAYCLVMLVPALALLALRVALRARVEPLLRRFSGWLERAGAEATGWVLGIAGFLVARDAVAQLFL
jgi:hypothetical protein